MRPSQFLRTTRTAAEVKQLREKAIRLKKIGLPYTVIAKRLGISTTYAWDLCAGDKEKKCQR